MSSALREAAGLALFILAFFVAPVIAGHITG